TSDDGALEPRAPAELAASIADYIVRQQRDDGGFALSYEPYNDERDETPADLPRLAHAAWVLARAGRREPARRAVAHLLEHPGEAAAALAAAALRGVAAADAARLARAFRFYRHRFRFRRDWGQVSWHARAWSTWFEALRDPEHVAFAFEVADFALEHQQATTG